MAELVQILKYSPVTEIKSRNSYIELPAFSVTGLTHAGYDELQRQYNFTATKRVILTGVFSKPDGVDYMLCIKYTVGETVTRYRVWEGIGESQSMQQYSLYTNQVLPKKFSLEVWNVSGQTTVTNASAQRIETSPTHDPIQASENVITELMAGALHTDYDPQNIPTSPVAGYNGWFTAESGNVTYEVAPDILAWNDRSGNENHLNVVSTTRPQTWGSGVWKEPTLPDIRFPSTAVLTMTNTPVVAHAFVVWASSVWTNAVRILKPTNGGNMDIFHLVSSGNKVGVGAANLGNAEPADRLITEVSIASGAFKGNMHGDKDGAFSSVLGATPAAFAVSVGDSVARGGTLDVAEILLYPTVLSDDDRALVATYLKNKWFMTPMTDLSYHVDVAHSNTEF